MQNDFIIMLAWPELMVRNPNSWYDWFFDHNGKYTFDKIFGKKITTRYRGGHSALILVNAKNNKLHYFDNGRYHTPFGFGRIRDAETDPDVGISFKAEIEDGEIKNIDDILIDAAKKKANHGEGTLYASVLYNIDFNLAFLYAKKIQNKDAIKYGPFVFNGTNCSRFTCSVAINSNPNLLKKIRLMFPCTVMPSPKRNISICNKNFYVVKNDICKKINRNIISGYFKSIERQ